MKSVNITVSARIQPSFHPTPHVAIESNYGGRIYVSTDGKEMKIPEDGETPANSVAYNFDHCFGVDST